MARINRQSTLAAEAQRQASAAQKQASAARYQATSPVVSKLAPGVRTREGAQGYVRDAKSELFLLAVANFASENTFYEKGDVRNARFKGLIRQVALEDPEWVVRMLRWLRSEANIRTASIIGAVEFVKARLDAKVPSVPACELPGLSSDRGLERAVIDAVQQRADEPAEVLAYWTSTYGRPIPKAVKRGVADGVNRLYNEFSFLKYDTGTAAFRFGDVIQLVGPKVNEMVAASVLKEPTHQQTQAWMERTRALYRFAVERRRGNDPEPGEQLRIISGNADLREELTRNPKMRITPELLQNTGMTWQNILSLLGNKMDKKVLWEALIPTMGYMACLAEGTPIWLADGTTAPIEDIVARRLPVLAYDKEWDTRPVKMGANQGPRDFGIGGLVPTVPVAWLDNGIKPVTTIRFVSGRTLDATYDHRWVRRRRGGRQSWEWTTTADLRVGDQIPVPLTANYFGDEGDAWDGYFVGAMLGDGGMTSLTPEFHGDPSDGAVEFMREFATKHGCGIKEYAVGKMVRIRFPFKQWKRNPVTEILRKYEVWGKRCEVKGLPNYPFSREFWIGALSGLIDTDGHVRERVNGKGTFHASVEYATVSRRLAEQVSDALLRLGVTNIIRERPVRESSNRIQSRHPLFLVEVNRAAAICRLADLLDLRINHKAARLASAASKLAHVKSASSDMHGYDESVSLDRITSIEDGGDRATYCVTVEPSSLFVANGLITGNCLRNLRNFDEAGVSDQVAAKVIARLTDPEEVARSRQFPFRFLSAYKATQHTLRWGYALEQALSLSLSNVPVLAGRTLVLVDLSGSMSASAGGNLSDMARAEVAALFGSAVALRAQDATLAWFATSSGQIQLPRNSALLNVVKSFPRGGGGTATGAAVRRWFNGHDRVVIITDEQAHADAYGQRIDASVPEFTPIYTWNLAGYKVGHAPSGSGNRHTFGGLTDDSFKLIPILESAQNADWPF